MVTPGNTERFWQRVDQSGACWIWRGAKDRQGYGRWMLWLTDERKGRKVLAHRWAYELTRGPIPDGLELNHKCRTPLCVNPEHLEAVSRAEHMLIDAPQRKHCRRYRPTRLNTSGYPNVTWHSKCRKWQAQVRVTGTPHYLGLFDTALAASRAVARFRKRELAARSPA